jgi:hypothetical protein
MAYDDGEGRANYKHVDGKLAEESGSREFAFGNSRKWYYGKTYEQMNQDAI